MQHLIGAVVSEWVVFDGWAVSHLAGADPLELPLDRLLNVSYFWLTRNASAEDRQKFDNRLWIPPKGEMPAPGSPWSAEKEMEAFGAFTAQVTGSKAPVAVVEGQK